LQFTQGKSDEENALPGPPTSWVTLVPLFPSLAYSSSFKGKGHTSLKEGEGHVVVTVVQ